MANPSVTNVDGSNPGPNVGLLPDTVQSPVGNLWKVGTFAIALTPAALSTGPSVGEQTFVGTAATASTTQYWPAIGLLTTDRVIVGQSRIADCDGRDTRLPGIGSGHAGDQVPRHGGHSHACGGHRRRSVLRHCVPRAAELVRAGQRQSD